MARDRVTDMKHYLLTWYGMTDLRAALGLEDTDGPVLSALKTAEYSDVVILAYTDPRKEQHALVGDIRDEWEEWFTQPTASRPPLAREKVHEVVDSVSNTESGHEFFEGWLRDRMKALGVDVSIRVVPKALAHLNDAAGIYEAAASAVGAALADPTEKRVTSYVSPGTPVMAYTWALIARSHPNLDIGVLSSSDPRLPPERIALPKKLLDASIQAPAEPGTDEDRYDLVIHLLGQQAIPVFFGMRQFGAKENLILTTRDFEDRARRLAKLAGFAPTPVVVADPFKAIARQVNKRPSDVRVAVNTTGGTKLMFAGALQACWELGLDPVYVEVEHHDVIHLRDGRKVPFVGISDVEDFIRASDFDIHSAGQKDVSDERHLSAAARIWELRSKLFDLYTDKRFVAFINDRSKDQEKRSKFALSWKSGTASLDASTAQLVLGGTEIDVPQIEFFKFLAGGWLEEHTYALLRPLEAEGVIRDLRIGLEVGYRKARDGDPPYSAQEFDCTFTDGKRLWIVECKAGSAKQEHIQKLENNLRLYGGVAARGILVTSRSQSQANERRLQSLPAITAVRPDVLSTDTLRAIIAKG
jgi:hypothetical protein